jgi:hypothetical protein
VIVYFIKELQNKDRKGSGITDIEFSEIYLLFPFQYNKGKY